MKRLSIFSVVLTMLALGVIPTMVSAGESLPWKKELPFDSAVIHYTITGMEEGKETVYIRDGGKEVATHHETVTKVMGMQMKNSTLELTTPEYVYTYDLETREGTKVTNPEKYLLEEYGQLSSGDQKKVRKNAQVSGLAMVENLQGKYEENITKILGYSCDKVEAMAGAESYVIHGTDIPLKTSVDMMGMKMDVVATSVEKGKVSDTFFQHPAGITAQHDKAVDAAAKQQAKMSIAMLIDPENTSHGQGQAVGEAQRPGMTEEDKKMMEQAELMMQQMKGVLNQ